MLSTKQVYLFSSYRQLRTALLTLDLLEESLIEDLRLLNKVEPSPGRSSLEGVLRLQLVSACRERVDEAQRALAVLRRHFDADPRFDDSRAVASLAEQEIVDEALRRAVMATVLAHGGLRGLLDHLDARLEHYAEGYFRAEQAASSQDAASAEHVLGIVLQVRADWLESLLDYWRQQIAAERASGDLPWTRIYLCSEQKWIAEALELDCPATPGMWPIILIAIACAILCKGD